ncbi:hypothetical protein ACVWWJ_002685 [Luteibacter sp. HA06]
MKIRIGFTLFSAPTEPYAIVYGVLELPTEPYSGEAVGLEWPPGVADIDGRCVLQRVKSTVAAEGVLEALHVLEDVVMGDRSAAQALGEFWAGRYGFDVDALTFDLMRQRNALPGKTGSDESSATRFD